MDQFFGLHLLTNPTLSTMQHQGTGYQISGGQPPPQYLLHALRRVKRTTQP
jgi:hypothetical protein